MGKREANRLRLQVGERAHVAGIVDEREGVGVAPRNALACVGRLRDRRLGNGSGGISMRRPCRWDAICGNSVGVRKGPSARITAR